MLLKKYYREKPELMRKYGRYALSVGPLTLVFGILLTRMAREGDFAGDWLAGRLGPSVMPVLAVVGSILLGISVVFNIWGLYHRRDAKNMAAQMGDKNRKERS